jgi:Trypsin-co-occurring domain 1
MDGRSERLKVLLPNGAEIWAEAQGVGPKEAEVVGFDDLKGALSLDSLRAAIEGMGTLALDALEKIKPDGLSVEFGLELAVDNGQITALWVKGSGKANLKITLSWRGRPSSGSRGSDE